MLLGLGALVAQLAPAQAQGQFSPVVRIDGNVITAYELSQRQAFLTLLRAPGDVRALALDQLINEALQMREAARAGIVAEEEDITAGMEEFAARGNLSADQLVQLLAQGGIAAESFRDFVTAGITWRDFLREVFLPKVSISQSDIDAAMAVSVPEPGTRVLLSEIILPAADDASRKASRARADRLRDLDEAGFADAAMRFSVGPSRNNGGKMKWLDIEALPAPVSAAVRGLEPGQTSRVVEVEDGVRLYYMRDREEVSGGEPRIAVEYAALLLPGGQSGANVDEAARIRERVTSCDDLYPIARGLPPEQLVRETLPESQVPGAYAGELNLLDPGEISARLTTSSGAMVVLMLCSRGNELPRSLTEEMVEEQIRNRRVTTLGQAFLEEQRANAHIEILGQ
ncbi:chaperone SurA [Sinisalibacter aestuarii]|uniref:Parvulin-like PPIase n=2 Tax=Sinisalibacter aestuarii TaxID=2949426 RepID=A0ABQ5LTV3_9RHOB|nr:chaperone SurA [Sinisalibacter aestuarii]